MSAITIYYSPLSVALATFIALEEAGADYEPRVIDFKTAEQRSEQYLAINPKGRVPALATERGIITETPAILAYIAQTHPAAGLAPLDDPFAFGQLQAFNNYLCATVHVAHAHRLRGSRWVDDPAAIEAMKEKVPQTMTECFTLIENELFRGPWVMGDNYSVADGYLFTVTQWLAGDSVDVEQFPSVADHSRRMQERPAVQRAMKYRQVS
ncbi:MAG: glutathione S-transferase family protein [Gammaproteobacteria bacterium]|jgi:glutathione S-transferase